MFLKKILTPGLAIYSYMLGDPKTHKMAVIDPVRDVDEFINTARKEGFEITDILETHVHADFVSGALELKKRLDDKPKIHCSGLGGEEWIPLYADRIVQNGDEVKLGFLKLKAQHTPGHTPEHITWELYDDELGSENPIAIFTGDFLFSESIGRPDLLGENEQKRLAHDLYHTVFHVLPKYPDNVCVYPSHGEGSLCGKAIGSKESTTMGEERKNNEALRKVGEDEWTVHLMEDMPFAPRYFELMKQVNVKGPQILGKNPAGLSPLSLSDIDAMDTPFFLDVRSEIAFAKEHIPGSLSIPALNTLAVWAGYLVPHDQPLVIIKEEDQNQKEIASHLLAIGLDKLKGYLEGGIKTWKKAGRETKSLRCFTVQELKEKIAAKEDVFVLDVRSKEEWNQGHIEGAYNLHGGTLPRRIDEVPKDRVVAVICNKGRRSVTASSFLERVGRKNITNVLGGMTAWKEL